uniref:BTB_2 domain-containing protein n=1 Tax=Panagrellus redivivus TaxID=6233 RepID=A0A7E4ZZS8_PANRE
MVYDDNIANILRKNQVFPNEMGFYRLDISDKVVLELLDLFLVKFNSLLVRPMVLLLAFQRLKPITLSEAIVEKIVSAGRFDGFCNIPEIPFNLVIIESNEDGKTLSCDFRTDTTI